MQPLPAQAARPCRLKSWSWRWQRLSNPVDADAAPAQERRAGKIDKSMVGMSLRPVIIAEFERVAREQERTLAPLSDDLVLLASGLDSLCLAIIIARLENTLGFDPFVTPDGVNLPVTVGNFIKSYEEGVNRIAAAPPVPPVRP
jgi:hypothetical protein